MKKLAVIFALVVSPSAFAQQQTPSQTALQINNVIGQWAQLLEAQQKQIAELREQLAEKQKEIDQLKSKP